MPALVAVSVGLLLGFAAGGSLSRLGVLSLRFEWLILPLFVVQGIARGRFFGLVGASELSLVVWTVTSSSLICLMFLNWMTPGMALGAAGILMNVNVVLLNGAMPVLIGERIGLPAAVSAVEVVRSSGGFYRVAAHGDLVAWLGDAMPVALGRSVLMASPGDVVLMIAVATTIVYGMSPASGSVHAALGGERSSATESRLGELRRDV